MNEGDMVQPSDVNAKEHLWNTFGHQETEVSAGWIVRFCQERAKGWEPFMREVLEQFYTADDRFWFNGLINGVWLSEADGVITILPEFIRCVSKRYQYEQLSASVVGGRFYS